MTTIYDIDGSVLAVTNTVVLMDGVTVKYFYESETATTPHEVVIRINDFEVERAYSSDLQYVIDNVETISAIQFFSTIVEAEKAA